MEQTKPKWIIALEDARRALQKMEQRPLKIKPEKTPYHERQEKVVNGIIDWEPVDKTAALVVSQAPWWAHAPNEKQKTTPKSKTSDINQTRKTKTKHQGGQTTRIQKTKERTNMRLHGVIAEQSAMSDIDSIHQVKYGSPQYDEWIKNVAINVAKELNNNPQELTKLARATIDARAALDEALYHIGHVQDEFNSKVKIFLNDVRSTRMSAVSEASSMTQPLKDIRQFFIGPDYSEQIKRLREFVELCERLMALKENGFLDKIVDTIIKLS